MRRHCLLPLQHPPINCEHIRVLLRCDHRPTSQNQQSVGHHQFQREHYHLRDLRGEIQAPLPEAVLQPRPLWPRRPGFP